NLSISVFTIDTTNITTNITITTTATTTTTTTTITTTSNVNNHNNTFPNVKTTLVNVHYLSFITYKHNIQLPLT
ncbi:unnamed protein product, partial [Schistosoma curassoni]|uniref:Integrin beta-like 1 n=1 Tax=Schistosoma curassoni TaxID=6186 RepID=A0A183JFT0_9TREM